MLRRRFLHILLNRWLVSAGLVISLLLVWGASSTDPRVWSARHTMEYHLLHRWWETMGYPHRGMPGVLTGVVWGTDNQPVEGVQVLLSTWDGTTYTALSGPDGRFRITDVPPGYYQPVAGKPGYASVLAGGLWGKVEIVAGLSTDIVLFLPPEVSREVAPGSDLQVGEAAEKRCETPITSEATRRAIAFTSPDGAVQPMFLYTPSGADDEATFPTLLTVYPGPVETWECTSVPLAALGYSIIAASPSYSLDLEQDVDDLARVLRFAREGELPNTDGSRVGVIGGSYSALLTQRLAQRDDDLDAALLLGPPTDLFDLRRRFEHGSFVPPFNLDRALIAPGFPDRNPNLYWLYSSVYHVAPHLPPTAIFHSYQDEIVPYQQSERLAEALEEQAIPYELHLFNGAAHYLLDDDAQALEIYERTAEFLAKHLR